MRRFFLCGLAAVAAVTAAVAPAYALKAAPGVFIVSTKQKVMQAEAVVVGKVSSIDKEAVDLEQYAGGPKVPHTVANVKLTDVLFGVKNVTHVKIVFVKPGDDQPQPGGGVGPGGPLPGRRPFPGQQAFVPAEDQEGVFFLQKHPAAAGYYVVQPGQAPLLSTDANYKDDLKTVTAMAAAFASPEKALAADKAEDRLTAALALAQKYRGFPANNPSGVVDEVAVPAGETKLFLKVLGEADWAKTPDAARLADALGLVPGSFGLPVALPADGEEPLAARQKAFKAWADKYAAKFEVRKYVAKAVPAAKAPTPGGVRPVPLPAPLPGGGVVIQPVPPVLK